MTADDLRRRLPAARQIAAVLTAFMLPVSTSGQAIAVSIFVVLALLTLDRERFDATMRMPAAYLPVLLFALLVIGTLWSTQPIGPALKWVGPYAKLLLIPLVMASVISPREALQIGYGFLAACLILLALSWASFLWPAGPWGWFKSPGVPVKDNAVQSGCFALCALGLAIAAVRIWTQGDRRRALATAMLALVFFADIFFIFVSKTGLLIALAMLGLLLAHCGGWRRAGLIAMPALLLVGVALWASAPAQRRLTQFSTDVSSDASAQKTSPESVSTAARMDFWTKAVGFIRQAPLFGHGTGSIKPLYQNLEATQPSPYGEATPDPHNQIFHVVLQVGLTGGILLLAMWIAHGWMFIGGGVGRGIIGVLGQAIVLQNVIGSLFNSHLITVTQGMLYCLAVGLLGAMVRGNQSRLMPSSHRSIPASASA